MNRHAIFFAVAAALGSATSSAEATDVVVQPASSSGFVVKDASGANERLRVQESGAVSLPSVAAAPAQSQGLCMGAGGQLGPCSGGTGNSYTAATGLALTGTTFSVAPTYRLPQSCAANQFAQWDGTAWLCGTAGGNLPTGKVNQTLRYDSSNTLVANSLLRAYGDSGFVAEGSYYPPPVIGAIPMEGDGIRLMWYPAKAAFRVGYSQLGQWDDGNIGVASVAMGNQTLASGGASTAMGEVTIASGRVSTAMGENTRASGDFSTALGNHTTASGTASTAIGDHTTADGQSSIAMGANVGSGGHAGSFIFGDASRSSGIVNDKDNQFMAIADGGFVLVSKANGSTGAELKPGNSSWTTLSDHNAKTAVRPVDGREVLKKVAALPLNTWQYKAQEAKYRHMGPMAQDFYAAFRLGESDKGIDTVDADGVALAAIQGLNAVLADKDREIRSLRAELATQKAESAAQNQKLAEHEKKIVAQQAEIVAQNMRMASLESLAKEFAEVKAQIVALQPPAPEKLTVAVRQP